jgi:hypothetical protein
MSLRKERGAENIFGSALLSAPHNPQLMEIALGESGLVVCMVSQNFLVDAGRAAPIRATFSGARISLIR